MKLDEIVDKYNNKYHRTIKTKLANVESGMYIKIGVNNNDKDPKFRAGGHVRISKYKNIVAKGYTSDCSEEVFVIKKV